MSTFAQLKDNVSQELSLEETASGDEDVLLGRRLNEGVREVLIELRCRVAVATVDLTANEQDYELPVDILAINKIINSDSRPLDHVSVEDIYELRRGTNPEEVNTRKYAVEGANLLMIYPMPDAADELTLYYVPRPTEMSSASHDPSSNTYGGIPVEYHDLIELWAMYKMASFDDDGSSAMGDSYRQRFELGCVKARKRIRRRAGRTLGPARIGRRSRWPWNNDQDIWRG